MEGFKLKEKIKEIYNAEKLSVNDSLIEWHNNVIEKTQAELTISDVARCIRQNIFVETAYEMLLVYLTQDPLAGDMYLGELMEKAREVDKQLILKHSKSLQDIIIIAEAFIQDNEWELEDEKEEFSKSVDNLKKIIGE
ncbi:MAG: hypothetical protein K6G75_06960 [Lachnospiraceae bacterium]|nr:hypothetical protein [Lachnospiraceae bacterium]